MIAEIHGGLPWRIGVVAGASAVFLLAFAATMYDMLAPGLACAPLIGCSHGTGVGGETDQATLGRTPVPHQLPDIQLPARAHFRGTGHRPSRTRPRC